MPLGKPEWFKFDPAAFLSDVQVDAMSTLELGACLRLLCRQWIDGHIPDDLNTLARLCRLSTKAMGDAWQTLAAFFPPVGPGKRANRFMWVEREKVVTEIEKRSDAGIKAARKRWDATHEDATEPPAHARPNGSPMPDPIQEQSREERSSTSELEGSSDAAPVAKRPRRPKQPSPQGQELAALLKNELLRNKPDSLISEHQEADWATTADLILGRDKRDFEEVCRVIRWTQADQFWFKNIRSMDSLRRQYDRLVLDMRSKGQPHSGFAPVGPAPLSASEQIRLSREVTQ